MEDPADRWDERSSLKRERSPGSERNVRRKHDNRHASHHDSDRRMSRSPNPRRDSTKRHHDHDGASMHHHNRRSRGPVEEEDTKNHRLKNHNQASNRQDSRPSHGTAAASSRGRELNLSRSTSSSRNLPHHRRRHRRSSTHSYASFRAPGELPFASRPLSKSDLATFKPLLARYLEIQKNKRIQDMDAREAKGRWKSFVGKWNEGTLAEGWYDPELFQAAVRDGIADDADEPADFGRDGRVLTPPLSGRSFGNGTGGVENGGVEDDDGYGPMPIPGGGTMRGSRQGPGIPSLDDLQYKREMAEEDQFERVSQLRQERKANRAQQKARLEELVPRAEPGTRERQLEKKKEINEKMKSFREKDDGAAELNDNELMGGGDSVEELKRMKAAQERRKTERELQREEIQRARLAEIEERHKEYREKEDSTMVMLKQLAKQRFG